MINWKYGWKLTDMNLRSIVFHESDPLCVQYGVGVIATPPDFGEALAVFTEGPNKSLLSKNFGFMLKVHRCIYLPEKSPSWAAHISKDILSISDFASKVILLPNEESEGVIGPYAPVPLGGYGQASITVASN